MTHAQLWDWLALWVPHVVTWALFLVTILLLLAILILIGAAFWRIFVADMGGRP